MSKNKLLLALVGLLLVGCTNSNEPTSSNSSTSLEDSSDVSNNVSSSGEEDSSSSSSSELTKQEKDTLLFTSIFDELGKSNYTLFVGSNYMSLTENSVTFYNGIYGTTDGLVREGIERNGYKLFYEYSLVSGVYHIAEDFYRTTVDGEEYTPIELGPIYNMMYYTRPNQSNSTFNMNEFESQYDEESDITAFLLTDNTTTMFQLLTMQLSFFGVQEDFLQIAYIPLESPTFGKVLIAYYYFIQGLDQISYYELVYQDIGTTDDLEGLKSFIEEGVRPKIPDLTPLADKLALLGTTTSNYTVRYLDKGYFKNKGLSGKISKYSLTEGVYSPVFGQGIMIRDNMVYKTKITDESVELGQGSIQKGLFFYESTDLSARLLYLGYFAFKSSYVRDTSSFNYDEEKEVYYSDYLNNTYIFSQFMYLRDYDNIMTFPTGDTLSTLPEISRIEIQLTDTGLIITGYYYDDYEYYVIGAVEIYDIGTTTISEYASLSI